MKLLKKEAQKIADNYRLGKVKKIKYMSTGWVNWNYKLETDSGKYVIKIIGGGATSQEYILDRMKIQIGLLTYLAKTNFPYEVIKPIKGKSKKYIMKIKKRNLWVYNYIDGDQKKRIGKKEFQDLAKTLATLHKYVKPFQIKRNDFEKTTNWLISEYKRLSKRKQKTKADKLFLENREFFLDLLKKIKKVNFGKMQTTHRDFHENNMIFRKGKIAGIIDFDGVKKCPRALDIALAILNTSYIKHGWTKEKQKTFFKKYEKISPLSKKEKNLVPILLIRHQALLFLWFYDEMIKNQDKVIWSMKHSLDETKLMLKEWEKQK